MDIRDLIADYIAEKYNEDWIEPIEDIYSLDDIHTGYAFDVKGGMYEVTILDNKYSLYWINENIEKTFYLEDFVLDNWLIKCYNLYKVKG